MAQSAILRSIAFVLLGDLQCNHATERLLLKPVSIGELVKYLFHFAGERTVTTLAKLKTSGDTDFRYHVSDLLKNSAADGIRVRLALQLSQHFEK